MSGSSYADHRYSRCVVGLNAGISISWAPDPDGSFDSGRRHHENEEARFRGQLARAAPAIEVMFDELEAGGRKFTLPDEPAFKDAQRADRGMPICSVHVRCTPPLSKPELDALVARIEAALNVPVPEPVEPAPAPLPVPPKPWWKLW